ncbi:hypothetical protein J5J10_02320 [Ciceribacter sp. L1K23]|uniref:capsular polysaccharide export protein, LipB/KpsS family n=1 Tax=Ciceribacter sp. L1K23 TaxID=2820276 RepID=UPI001B810F99|nr:glycosyltransferase [Ciceribacter sp. L1K23]MBR0554501.1 hypothetical protein [Ciceribacter sp. L1K23]
MAKIEDNNDTERVEKLVAKFVLDNISITSSLAQDVFALFSKCGRPGTYLEIGAGPPNRQSSTHLLATNGWHGVVVDPHPDYGMTFASIQNVRHIAKAVTASRYASKSLLRIYDTRPELSVLNLDASRIDRTKSLRSLPFRLATVETVAIGDLVETAIEQLDEIDFLAVNLGGIGNDILDKFPFERTKPIAIYASADAADGEDGLQVRPDRLAKIEDAGYVRVLGRYTSPASWYLRRDVITRLAEQPCEAPQNPSRLQGYELHINDLAKLAVMAVDTENYEAAIDLTEALISHHQQTREALVALQRAFREAGLDDYSEQISPHLGKLASAADAISLLMRDRRRNLATDGSGVIIIDNTIAPGAAVKLEICHALRALGYEICSLGEKLIGRHHIPYRTDEPPTGYQLPETGIEFIEYRGINLWDVCRGQAGYLNTETTPVEPSQTYNHLLGPLFERAINFIDFFEAVIKNNRPAGVVVWGGMLLEPRIMTLICKRHGVPVFATEFSFDTTRIHFDADGRIGNEFSFNRIFKYSQRIALNEAQSANQRKWVESNYKGKAKTQPEPVLSERFKEYLASLSGAPLLLLCQCFIDTVITYDNPNFDTSLSAYFSVIDICERNAIPLIVKTHPGDKEQYHTTIREYCEGKQGIIYVGKDVDENVYCLMDVARAGVTINSQSGLEMLSKGKRVLCLGRAFYAEAGLCEMLASAGEAETQIQALYRARPMDEAERRFTDAYVYRLRNSQLIDVSASPLHTARQLRARIAGITMPSRRPDPLLQDDRKPQDPTSLRIIITHPSPSWAGSGFYLQDIAVELQKLGHHVAILAEGSFAPYDTGIRWHALDFEGPLLSRSTREFTDTFKPNLVLQVGVRTKPMRAALELCVAHKCVLVVQAEDDEFVPFQSKYPKPDMSLLETLDNSVVFPGDLVKLTNAIDLEHLTNVLSDPGFDRWVEPVLRSTLYHSASGYSAIWHPMAERLEERFGKKAEILPPVVRLEHFDRTPLSAADKQDLRRELGIEDASIVYFINGTIYTYSKEFQIFIEALNSLQRKSGKSIVLLVCSDVQSDNDNDIKIINLGRLGDKAYNQIIKLSDVICAPGINDTFNKFRLSSRLVKGMIFGKPIFTFKTGFAEHLEDNKDGFFTHTDDVEEWAEVLSHTLEADKREAAGQRGIELVEKWFSAATVAQSLSKAWLELVAKKEEPRAVASGLFSADEARRRISEICFRQMPMAARQAHKLTRGEGTVIGRHIGSGVILLGGFATALRNVNKKGIRHEVLFADRSSVSFAVTPFRVSPRIEISLSLGLKDPDVGSHFNVYDIDGQVKSQVKIKGERLHLSFSSWNNEFIVTCDLPKRKTKSAMGRWILHEVNVHAANVRFPQAIELRSVIVPEVHAKSEFKARRYVEAARSFMEAAAENPEEPLLLCYAAEAYWRAGDRKKASELQQAACLKMTTNRKAWARLVVMRMPFLRPILGANKTRVPAP